MLPSSNDINKSDLGQSVLEKSSRPSTSSIPTSFSAKQATILLTGSTGSLGTYLLDELLRSPLVKNIVVLNRNSNALSAQASSYASRGLQSDFSRVAFHTWTPASATLGLSAEVYDTLRSSITHMIHNAWPVNFNASFSFFAPSINGVRNLIALAHASTLPRKPSIFFISSISVAANWSGVPGTRLRVPEQPIEDWRVARMGYGQSKLVAERLLVEASKTGGMNVAIFRVGQVAGPVLRGEKGVWNQREWLPSLVRSSQTLGVLPDSLGPIDEVQWMPVDLLARAAVEMLFVDPEQKKRRVHKNRVGSVKIWHGVNPRIARWSSLLPTIRGMLGGDVTIVTLGEWVEAVRVASETDLDKNPAVRLLDFFENLEEKARRFPDVSAAMLDMKHTVKQSKTIAEMQIVNDEWMRLWMRQWELQA